MTHKKMTKDLSQGCHVLLFYRRCMPSGVHAFLVGPLNMQSVRHLFGWPIAYQVLVWLLVRSDECELDKWRTTNERVCQRKATESSGRLCLVESVPSLVHAQTKPDWTGIAWQGALLPNVKRTRNKLIEILFSVERMLALSGRRDSSCMEVSKLLTSRLTAIKNHIL